MVFSEDEASSTIRKLRSYPIKLADSTALNIQFHFVYFRFNIFKSTYYFFITNVLIFFFFYLKTNDLALYKLKFSQETTGKYENEEIREINQLYRETYRYYGITIIIIIIRR